MEGTVGEFKFGCKKCLSLDVRSGSEIQRYSEIKKEIYSEIKKTSLTTVALLTNPLYK